jgi:aminoglycoside 2'-N-acetyltransferase I
LRTGYVEAMAVRADRRGEGFGAVVMRELESAIDAAYELGALGSTDEAAGFYAARGWRLWRGSTFVMTESGLERTPDEDGAIYVWPGTAELDLDGDLACDWRPGDVW